MSKSCEDFKTIKVNLDQKGSGTIHVADTDISRRIKGIEIRSFVGKPPEVRLYLNVLDLSVIAELKAIGINLEGAILQPEVTDLNLQALKPRQYLILTVTCPSCNRVMAHHRSGDLLEYFCVDCSGD